MDFQLWLNDIVLLIFKWELGLLIILLGLLVRPVDNCSIEPQVQKSH